MKRMWKIKRFYTKALCGKSKVSI